MILKIAVPTSGSGLGTCVGSKGLAMLVRLAYEP